MFVKMMDESADPLRDDGYVDLGDGNLVVVVRHEERFTSEVVGGTFTLRVKVDDHGNLFGAGCRLDND